MKRSVIMLAFALWSGAALAQQAPEPTQVEVQLRFQLGQTTMQLAQSQAQEMDAKANAAKREGEWAKYSEGLWPKVEAVPK